MVMVDYVQSPSHYEEHIAAREFVANTKKQAFGFMDQMEGWCSQEKGSLLIDLVQKVQPQKIVEIGVWGGKSLIPMAAVLRANGKGKIYGIDPWSNVASIEETMHPDNKAFWGWIDHEAVMQRLMHNIDAFGLGNQIELIRSTSEDADPITEIDILHVDGNHSEKTSYLDVTKWVPLVKSGGWIIFDDMSWYENGVFTTAKAVQWLNEHCIKIAEFNDICLWGIWVKP
jgi:predicted O-methyltransferase YrrM